MLGSRTRMPQTCPGSPGQHRARRSGPGRCRTARMALYELLLSIAWCAGWRPLNGEASWL